MTKQPGDKDRKATKIVAEGIWRDGTVRRFNVPWPGCSTGVATMYLQNEHDGGCLPAKEEPWLTRIYHDDILVREFDYERQRYTLAIDGGCDVVPPSVPVPEPVK